MSFPAYFRVYEGRLNPSVFDSPSWYDLLQDEDAADLMCYEACDISVCEDGRYIVESFSDRTFWCSVASTNQQYILVSYEDPSLWIHPSDQAAFAQWLKKQM